MSDPNQALARQVAFEVGDTFICYDNMAPVEQWARVLRVLSEAGWSLVRLDDLTQLARDLAADFDRPLDEAVRLIREPHGVPVGSGEDG